MYYHHTLRYPDGAVFEGKLDHEQDVPLLQFPELKGKTVLDIATNDGFWAFWAEMNGAEDVVAIDVGSYGKYDWGPGGPPDGIDNLKQQDKWKVFDFHHSNLGSAIEKHELSIFDMEQLGDTFDIIINYGLLYHLRHPQLSLDICRVMCSGMMVLETQILPHTEAPIFLECGPYTGILTMTDNNWPTAPCVASWLLKAGFKDVFIQYGETQRSPTRQRFIATVTDEMSEHVSNNPNFFRADDAFWSHIQNVAKETFKMQK